MDKILLIDKPAGWTSFDVVAKIRGAARQASGDKKIKVGHAGTLDPFATGLLIVLAGRENTAKQDSFMKQDKEYEATLKLGFTSTTGDPEGEVSQFPSNNFQFSVVDVEKVLKRFKGEISQIPPTYSAIKIDGKRAYKLAREGKAPEMKARKVTIYSLIIEDFEYPELKIVVKCSSGTYIRTLACDIGMTLGPGAYLTGLRRTKIGEYDIKDALTVEEAITELSFT